MTRREALDIASMEYFIPGSAKPAVITDYDRTAMAELSSRGIRPAIISQGLTNLMWGKTYREVQIDYWKRDIRDGLIELAEILNDLPEALQPMMKRKLS